MTATTTAKNEVVRLDVPVVPGEMDGHVPRYLGMRLTLAQGRALKRLTESLLAAHARLGNGRHVEDGAGAARWILEQFEAGALEIGDGDGKAESEPAKRASGFAFNDSEPGTTRLW